MRDASDLTRGWVRKGDSDLAVARLLLASNGPFDAACFHCQQAAEKYLKSLLVLANAPLRLTHDLVELREACRSLPDPPDLSGIDLAALNPFAVEGRYDLEFWPAPDAAGAALAIAERVRTAILAKLPPAAQP